MIHWLSLLPPVRLAPLIRLKRGEIPGIAVGEIKYAALATPQSATFEPSWRGDVPCSVYLITERVVVEACSALADRADFMPTSLCQQEDWCYEG